MPPSGPLSTFLQVATIYSCTSVVMIFGNLSNSLRLEPIVRILCGVRDMERVDAHASFDLIRSFACGMTVLRPEEFQHRRGCDECSDKWLCLKQGRSGKTATKRSRLRRDFFCDKFKGKKTRTPSHPRIGRRIELDPRSGKSRPQCQHVLASRLSTRNRRRQTEGRGPYRVNMS